MDREQDPPIARGRTAEIYAWDNDTVLKLFYEWVDMDSIEYEAKINRAVHASGLPVPTVGEIVSLNGRCGLVYERVYGATMAVNFQRSPWKIFHFARRMAQLQAEMHTAAIQADLPQQRLRLAQRISSAAALPDPAHARALEVLQTLPDGKQVCHGDFHPENILLTERGEVIIDWVDATRGNPLADLARTTIILLGAAETVLSGNILLKGFVQLFHAAYLRQYFRLLPGGQDEYRRWLPVVAAARLDENITEQEKWLITQAEKVLTD